jgi:hypothetical protein
MRFLLITLCAGSCLFPVRLAAQPVGPEAFASPQEPDAPLLLDVPFVAQEPLLCGGAAVEMALRHLGASGVWARDFRGLVREEEGGIRTDDLARAVRALGWRAAAGPSDAAELHERLEEGHPVVVLLSERGGRYHYVLVVGWEDGAVVVHDPGEGPGVRIPAARFLERWEESGHWALAVLGREPAREDARAGTPEQGQLPERRIGPETSLARASALFRAERWAEAAREAERATAERPDDLSTWRLLGTSRYLAGDDVGALRAWNRAGAPRVEMVGVTGLARTRHPVVHRLMGLRPGLPLAARELERARRRIGLLPSAETTSLGYRALPGERVEVTGAVLERPLLPDGPRSLAAPLLSALARSEARAIVASPTGGGEAVEIGGRWSRARPAASAGLTAPGILGLSGVGRLRLEWSRERHRRVGEALVSEEERTGARLEIADWATPEVFWRLGAGLDRWRTAGRVGVLEAGTEIELRPVRVRAGLEAAGGAGMAPGYLRWDVEALSALPSRGPWTAHLRLLAAGVGADAPWSLRPGAGTGRARDGLLRAHPIEHEGALAGSRLGTQALNATAELGLAVFELAPLARLELAVFLDALRLSRPSGEAAGGTLAFLDAGAGIRARLPGGTLRFDAAFGGNGARALSLGWEATRGPLR